MILACLVSCTAAKDDYTVMEINESEFEDFYADYLNQSIYDAQSNSGPSDPKTLENNFPKTSYSDWNQGTCGNCWVWGSTAAVAQSYYKFSGISTPLSIQFFDSNYFNGNIGQAKPHAWACTGGDVVEFAEVYNNGLNQSYDGQPFVIPWSNVNASYGDITAAYNKDNETLVPKEWITVTPNMGFYWINPERILSNQSDRDVSITNITESLLDGKVITYTLYWSNRTNFNSFEHMWDYEPDTLYDPTYMDGEIYDLAQGASGHTMVLVGYNKSDPDPDGWYWIVQNSWGTSENRSEGKFKLKMNISYNASLYTNSSKTGLQDLQYFTMMNVSWKTDPVLSGITPSSGETGSSVYIPNLSGTGFQDRADVALMKNGSNDIVASNVTVVSGETITCDFDLVNASPGSWDVIVTNTDNRSATLENGFRVTAPVPVSGGGEGDGQVTSCSVTSPGALAGGTMTFSVNQPLSGNSPDMLVSVQVTPSRVLGSTDLLVSGGGAVDTSGLNDRTIVGIVSLELAGVNPSAVSGAAITFTVTGQRLSENGLKPEDIVLMRNHNGAWSELPTTFDHEENGIYYFAATTPGFSYFAITGRTNATDRNTTDILSHVPVQNGTPSVTAVPEVTRAPATAATSVPAATKTTQVPVADEGTHPVEGIPVVTVVIAVIGIVVAAAAGILVRRWWIRRQNPALFRKYD
ncbi:MAG: PGF-pre-PGF domain-containing protein [Methanoregulaceae archaeon]